MYCSNCGALIGEENLDCQKCGRIGDGKPPSLTISGQRPMAGIVVACILGLIGIVWSGIVLFRDIFGLPSSIEVQLFQIFPELQTTGFLSNSLGFVGSTAVLIGAILSLLDHPNGKRTVRITCLSMLSVVLLFTTLSLLNFTGSPHWSSIDLPVRGSLIGGVIGGAIGAAIQWGLILYLFRKRKWG